MKWAMAHQSREPRDFNRGWFRNGQIAEDCLFTCCLVCSAQRYVRVPNIINFYRVVENSVSHKPVDIAKKFHRHLDALKEGFNYLEKFLSKREFFQKRSDMKYLLLEIWVRDCCNFLLEHYAKIPAWQLDPLIRREFENFSDKTALMAFIFSRMNVINLQMLRQNQVIQQLQAK